MLGNQQFYGSGIAVATGELKRVCAGTHSNVLDNNEVGFDGMWFVGTTL